MTKTSAGAGIRYQPVLPDIGSPAGSTPLHQVATVNHQGTVVAFGQVPASDAIFYNILDLQVSEQSDELEWTGFTRLAFPPQLRAAGLGLVTVDDDRGGVLSAADVPLRAVSDGRYICLFRQSQQGTLLLNRFMLKRLPTTPGAPAVAVLEPIWEVRYQRSGKRDVPGGPRDSQTYTAPDGTPFIEPTIELPMVHGLSDGRFDVLALPNEAGTERRWHIIAVNAATGKLDFFSFPMDENGLMTFTAKPPSADGLLAPDASVGLALATDKDPQPLDLAGAPRATMYALRERVRAASGDIMLKRTTRVMIAQPVHRAPGQLAIATLDLALAKDGTLTDIDPATTLGLVKPAPGALAFARGAQVALTKPVELRGSFCAEFWLCPASPLMTEGYIFSGDDGAPYAKITSGRGIEVGFGVGAGAVAARTTRPVVAAETWVHVRVSFVAGAQATGTFAIEVNGHALPITGAKPVGLPPGAPIRVVGTNRSAARPGVVGTLARLEIRDGGGGAPTPTPATDWKVVGSWSFDQVDYGAAAGPTTADASPAANDAIVSGAVLVSLTAPVPGVIETGQLQIDGRGLTVYAGLLDFVAPQGCAELMTGSDGLLHLYYEEQPAPGDGDAGGRLTVVQYDAQTSRAAFGVPWTSSVAAQPSTGQTQLVAARAGTFMNDCQISVGAAGADSLDGDLCDLTIDDRQGRSETWRGVPRAADAFEDVLGGASTSDLDDPGLRAGTRTFYDNLGSYATARLAIGAPQRAHVVVASRHAALPLAVAEVGAVANATCTLTLGFSVAQWAPAGGAAASVRWQRLPVQASAALSVLAGTAHGYDYAASATDCRLHTLAARDRAGNPHNLLLLTRNAISELQIGVAAGAAPDRCSITVRCTAAGQQPYEVQLPAVARDRVQVALAINGDPRLGGDLLALADGLQASLLDRALAPLVPDDLKAWSTVVATFADDATHADAPLVASGPVPARTRQGAALAVNGVTSALLGPSTMIRAAPTDRPGDGGIALVQNTTQLTGGVAYLLVAASNGGWLRRSPDQAIDIAAGAKAGIGWVLDGDAPQALATDADVTTEVWCDTGRASAGTRPRILTYHHVGSPAHPGELIQHALGLSPAPSLRFGFNTTVTGGGRLPRPACSVQIWLCLESDAKAGSILSIHRGPDAPRPWILAITIDASLHVVAFYEQGPSKLKSHRPLTPDRWTQVTVTLAGDEAAKKMTMVMYIDGEREDSRTDPLLDLGVVGTLTLGQFSSAQQVVSMRANGAFMWRRTLSDDEVRGYFATPVPDNDSGLLAAWHLTDGERAAHGPTEQILDRAVEARQPTLGVANTIGPTTWSDDGAYTVAVAANRDYVVRGFAAPMLPGHWHHIAASYRTGYALRVAGADYADCGNDRSLDFVSALTVEAWITPQRLGVEQSLVSKVGNYELGISSDDTIVLTIWTSTNERATVRRLQGTAPLEIGQPCHVVGVVQLQTRSDDNKSYRSELRLYRDGETDCVQVTSSDHQISMATTDARLNLARSAARGAYFTGDLSNVRLWSRALPADEIRASFRTRRPTRGDGLVSAWRFGEQQGKVAYDDGAINNARLSSNALWALYKPAGALDLIVDGVLLRGDVEVVDPATIGGYGAKQLTVGSPTGLVGPVDGAYRGQLNDLRIWSVARSAEQIREDMYRELTGAEAGLAGYWPLDTGSGPIAFDATGHANNGTFFPADKPPKWITSTAPISTEGKEVYNALGDVDTSFHRRVTGPPCAVDYADTRTDAYGRPFAVMKRCYAADTTAGIALFASFKVGDLDVHYAGQVQTSPSLVGFIEGAPPIPSENQTNPWWDDDNYRNTYADTAKARLVQAQSTTQMFSSGESLGTALSMSAKVGVFLSEDVSVGIEIGGGVDVQVFMLEGRLGAATEIGTASSSSSELGFGFGKATTTTDEASAGGEWEPADKLLNPAVGRRYQPDNTGYAVVKSLTADLYMVTLRGSDVVVSMALVPDPAIPEDVNIIDFPIDPNYVKNGTLDGMVGFTPDPSFPAADIERGSYFKPVQAYAMKRAIERQDKQLEAYYFQFDTANHSRGSLLEVIDRSLSIVSNVVPALRDAVAKLGPNVPSGFATFRDETLPADPSYDWRQRLAKRNAVNTYVWTAGGGLHTEQSEFVDTYSESYSGISSWDLGNGPQTELASAAIVGAYMEFDALYGNSLERSSVKRKESESSFGVEVEFAPDRYLKRPLVADGAPAGYTADDAPGKVSGYRFMTFLLAPTTGNFDAFQSVIDQNWLRNSADPAAAALRTATVQANGAWRILHRVTYVSRVPPIVQPTTTDTTPSPVTPPANMVDNVLLLRLVRSRVPGAAPTPAQIGSAVTAVLASTGALSKLLSWWGAFLTLAADPRNQEHLTLAELRSDLLTYLVQTYALSSSDLEELAALERR